MGKVISITNQKGGVGKTTTAINLASILAEENKKVLLIDIDSQGNATQGLGVDKQEIINKNLTTFDMLLNLEIPTKEYIIKTKFKNLDIIGGSQQLSALENNISGDMKKEMILKFKVDEIKNQYDYIIIDNPPALGTLTLNGLSAADSIIIPVQSEFYALEGMSQLLQSIRLCQKHLNKNLKIEGILISMYMGHTRLSEEVRNEVIKYFGNYVFDTSIRRNVALAEAPSYGEPINYYKRASNGYKDFKALTLEVLANE